MKESDLSLSAVRSVCHEAGTPLQTVLLRVELLTMGTQGELTEGQARLVKEVGSTVRGLSELMAKILRLCDLSRAPALETAPIELAPALRAASELCAEAAEARGVSVEVAPTSASVLGDRSALDELLGYLLGHAVERSPEGGGPVRVETTRRGHRMDVEVLDQGEPVAPEDREAIFTPLAKPGGGRLAADERGTGLAIARLQAERMGATLTVHPCPGGAASNRWRLELAAAEAAEGA